MKTTITLLLLSLSSSVSYAQDYVDILKISGNTAILGNEGNSFKTRVNNLNTEFYYPKKVNENLVVLSGFTFENTNLSFFPTASRGNLINARLNLGIKHQHSERWSGTYVLLPKLASDFNSIGSKDFQMGGLVIMDYQLSETWKLKFGLYSSSENFGVTLTPIIGVWHRSKNKKFYINATLPIRMDMNYAITKVLSVGADLLTSIKSYNLSKNNAGLYVQEESIRMALYLCQGFLNNSLLVRVKGGYDTTDYGLFASAQKVGVQVLTVPLSGDSRFRFNSEFTGAPYFGADLIYRFDLTKEKK